MSLFIDELVEENARLKEIKFRLLEKIDEIDRKLYYASINGNSQTEWALSITLKYLKEVLEDE